jgi:uncharacterized protein (DUF58 family)
MNFEEVREYQPGDEVRTIDWNVTARFGEVRGDAYVKKFTEERELIVMLVVDVSASGNFGSVHLSKRELAAEGGFAAGFQRDPQQRQSRSHSLFRSRRTLHPAEEKAACTRSGSFARFSSSSPPGAAPIQAVALQHLNHVLHRRAVVFLISDFQAPDFSKELGVTSRRHDLIAIPVVDPREEELPDVGLLTLEDAETGEQLEVNTSDRSARLAFLKAVEQRTAARLREFRSKRIDTIALQTDQDYLPALRTFFRNRERRLMIR